MELSKKEKDIVRRKFCKYCIKVMEGEALYYLRQLEKQQEHRQRYGNFVAMMLFLTMILPEIS